jgi:hypothetical protein
LTNCIEYGPDEEDRRYDSPGKKHGHKKYEISPSLVESEEKILCPPLPELVKISVHSGSDEFDSPHDA